MHTNESQIHESIYESHNNPRNARGEFILESHVVPMRVTSKNSNEMDFSKTGKPAMARTSQKGLSFEERPQEKRPQTASKIIENKTSIESRNMDRVQKPSAPYQQFMQYYEENIKLKAKQQEMQREIVGLKNRINQVSQVRTRQNERELEMLAGGKRALWDAKEPVYKQTKGTFQKDKDSAKVSNLLEIIQHYKAKLMTAEEQIQNLKRQKHLLQQDTRLKQKKANQLLQDLNANTSSKPNTVDFQQQLRSTTKLLQIEKQRNRYNEADIKRLQTKIRTLQFNKEEMDNLKQQNRTLEEQLMRLTSMPSFSVVADKVDEEKRFKEMEAKYKAMSEKYTQVRNEGAKMEADVRILRNQLIKANAEASQLQKENAQLRQNLSDNPILTKLSQDQKLLQQVVYEINKKKSQVAVKSQLEKQSYDKILLQKEMLANELTSIRNKMTVLQENWKEKERLSKIEKEEMMSTFREQAGAMTKQDKKTMSKNGVAYTDDVGVFTQDIMNINAGTNYFDVYLGDLSLLETMMSTNFNIRNTESTIILATVDFYNHNTETTRPVHGINCNLQSEFSFKVTEDEFFFKYLSKGSFNVEIWGSEGNKRVQIGKAIIDLKPLVMRSRKNMAPVVSSSIPIYMNQKIMGSINYVMRMRLPIFDQLQKITEIDQMVSTEEAVVRKLIIQVEEGRGFSPNSNTFVYFSFRLEDYYSKTFKGSTPAWNYYKTIELKYNNDLKNYLRKNQLQFVILDDNAVIANEGDSDVIGTGHVSLVSLLENKAIKERVPVMKGTQRMGQIDIKIYWHEIEPLDIGPNREQTIKSVSQSIQKFLTKTNSDPDKIFPQIDKNRTGMINFQQFFTWILHVDPSITYEMANNYYLEFRQPVNMINFNARIQADRSGQTNQIAKQLSEINRMVSENTEMIKKKQSLQDFLRDKDVKDVCIDIDKNGNGVVTRQELHQYFEAHNIEPPEQALKTKDIEIFKLINKYQILK